MGNKKSASSDIPHCPIEPRNHAEPYETIIDLGHAVIRRAQDPAHPRSQHGFVLQPKLETLVSRDDAAQEAALAYVRQTYLEPGRKQFFYVKPSQAAAGAIHPPPLSITSPQSITSGGLATGLSRPALALTSLPSALGRRKSFTLGISCGVCASSDMNDPWRSRCGHVCCADCWTTWLRENSPHPQCPVCDASVDPEHLIPLTATIPTAGQPQPSSASHVHDGGDEEKTIHANTPLQQQQQQQEVQDQESPAAQIETAAATTATTTTTLREEKVEDEIPRTLIDGKTGLNLNLNQPIPESGSPAIDVPRAAADEAES